MICNCEMSHVGTARNEAKHGVWLGLEKWHLCPHKACRMRWHASKTRFSFLSALQNDKETRWAWEFRERLILEHGIGQLRLCRPTPRSYLCFPLLSLDLPPLKRSSFWLGKGLKVRGFDHDLLCCSWWKNVTRCPWLNSRPS